MDEFHGLPVLTFPQAVDEGPLPGAASVAWRLRTGLMEGDEDSEVYLERFCEAVPMEEVRALIIGSRWYGSDGWPEGAVAAVVDMSSQLTNLEALFLGDVDHEESEMSWLLQCDVGPVLEAYPRLRELGVRGAEELEFTSTRHENLRVLRMETGGLPGTVTRSVAACDLPALEYLELWLGDDEYGCDTTMEDLAPLFSGECLPSLRHLGLQNSQFQDEIAAAMAHAPVPARLESLRLSMGTLGDEGAQALLDGQSLTHLRFLDLHHHYLSDAMMLRVWDAFEPLGVRVDLSGQQKDEGDDDNRYVAVAE
ncbi:STM4015 family protein [Streptomyces sp. NPDC006285]|uniref:STM4015 family protein n=1 Tax=Streptomyces sp. NPDC006285 TaxID=3364742 RepID=UPI0036783D78